MKPTLLTLSLAALTLFGCKKEAQNDTETNAVRIDSTAPAPDMHTSETALDWPGTYEGVVPCADCPGIEPNLTLNEDNTFELSVLYQDREKKPTVSKGNFTFDATGNIITLDKAGNNTSYKVKEGCLAMLDGDKKEIEGALKANYILNKNH